jgi:hypothetical protein
MLVSLPPDKSVQPLCCYYYWLQEIKIKKYKVGGPLMG